MMINRACFAVVGHPNKGKSSIVSTLSQNNSILISQQSGTTVESQSYRIELPNAGYELIDTPGFQRPRKALKWLQSRADNASQRASAVNDFCNDPFCQKQFPDEVALLTPITKGAAILYVVDGSRPFGVEYEAEMEILRWTGQPSMALINPIESERHVVQWENALKQFFKTVTTFNPMTADFEKQIALLETFIVLNKKWAGSLKQLVADLRYRRLQQQTAAAKVLALLLEDVCHYSLSQKVITQKQAQSIKPAMEKSYQQWMVDREAKAQKELLSIYLHDDAHLMMTQFELPPFLFEQSQWYAWGLNKQQLLTAATIAGATAGAAIDLAVAGSSFMLGAIGGGVTGFSSAFFGANKLVTNKIKGIPLGGYESSVGPINNLNFPYVILGRFIYLYQQIKSKNHANRQALTIAPEDFQAQVSALEKSEQSALHKACKKLISQKVVDDLPEILLKLL